MEQAKAVEVQQQASVDVVDLGSSSEEGAGEGDEQEDESAGEDGGESTRAASQVCRRDYINQL